MTSVERVRAAYSLREPDRVPVFPMVTYASGAPIGYSLREYCHDVEKMIKGQLHLQKWLDCDFVLSFVDVWVFAEAVGVKLDFPDNNTPNPVEFPVKSSEDVEKLQVPDAKRDGRLPIIVEGIERLRKQVGGKIAIYTGGQGPFSLAAEIRGLQAFLKDLYVNRDLALKLVKFCTEYMVEMGKAEAQAGADIVHLGDSFAGPSLVSPKFFRDYAMSYDKIVFDQWKKEGVLTSLHICGRSTPIWDDMVGTGTHNIEVDQTVDLAEAKSKVGDRVCLTGNIDPSAVIRHGTTEEVERKTRECIQAAGSGGGYVLSPGCVVMPGFPQENLETMMRVARESGRYS
jgi:uroporphyrinogen decarboxylase